MASNCATDDESFNLAPRNRYCATDGCRARLAALSLDPHTFCVACRGCDCDLSRRCVVCTDWDIPAMEAYLLHQEKLKKKRESSSTRKESVKGKDRKTPPGAGDPPLRPEEDIAARDARLEARLQKSMEDLFERRQRDLMASVVSEITKVLSSSDTGKPTEPSQNEEPVPPGPSGLQGWMSDPRYVGAKPLYDSGLISEDAFNNIITVCQADSGTDSNVLPDNATPVGPPPNKKPRPEDPDEVIESNVEPDVESIVPEPDFGDLVTCIISFLPDAKENEIFEKANEFLIGAAASTNVRQFVRLKLFKEIGKGRQTCNEKVKKVSYGQGHKSVGGVWPRRRFYYKVGNESEVVKINPRLAELSSTKNFPPTFNFSFSLADSHNLDRALAELIQAQSFSFWLLSAFFLFLDQEDFTPTNLSLYHKFTSVISSVMKSQNEWVISVQAFLTLLRRRSLLNKLFPSVLNHQKELLFSSPCFQEYVFDEEVLEGVIASHSKSQMDNSHVQLVKLVSSQSAALSKASSSFAGRGYRRPYSRPFFPTRGRGGRGGRGRGRGGKPNPPKQKQGGQKNSKNA